MPRRLRGVPLSAGYFCDLHGLERLRGQLLLCVGRLRREYHVAHGVLHESAVVEVHAGFGRVLSKFL